MEVYFERLNPSGEQMNIDDDHLYHGAALIQIAEHPSFTAINSLEIGGKTSRVAYKINDKIAVYLKYRTKPTANAYAEYTFTFHEEHLADLATIDKANGKTFIALVCVKAREICCVTYAQLMELVKRRRKAKGHDEEAYVILVTAKPRQKLRAYINRPGRRGMWLGEPIKVSRDGFPGVIFD